MINISMDDYMRSQRYGCLDAYFIKRISRSIEMSVIFETNTLDRPIRSVYINKHNDLHKNQ